MTVVQLGNQRPTINGEPFTLAASPATNSSREDALLQFPKGEME